MDTSLQDAISIAIGWLSREVPAFYSWLFAEHGGIANAILVVGLVAALFRLRKSHLENRELSKKIEVLPLQLKNLTLQADKLRQEIDTLFRKKLSDEIAAKKDEFQRIEMCVSMIVANSSELFRDLRQTFLPPLTAPDPTKWADRLEAIYRFRYDHVNRPKIETAMGKLRILAERPGHKDDLAIELCDQAEEFLRAVTARRCHIDALAACAGTLDEKLRQNIQQYVDEASEARKPIPGLAGKVLGQAEPLLALAQ